MRIMLTATNPGDEEKLGAREVIIADAREWYVQAVAVEDGINAVDIGVSHAGFRLLVNVMKEERDMERTLLGERP
jgi:hypothetical protein